MDGFVPQLVFVEGQPPRLGEQWVDEYLRFTAARLRPNSVLAQAFDLKVFFTVVGKPPVESTRRLTAELVDDHGPNSVPNSPATIARALTGRGLGR